MSNKKRSPWSWVPSLYFAEGLPYVAVMTISVVMYKNLGLSNEQVAFYTSWLYLPWVIKPIWSPFVDLLKSKRWWVISMQLLIGAGFAVIALTLPTSNFFKLSLAFFWLVAFSSATHDIAADGFYMLALPTHQQAAFVGIRSTFYRVATIAGQGVLVAIAGLLESSKWLAAKEATIPLAWSITFLILASFFIGVAFYHRAILDRPSDDVVTKEITVSNIFKEFLETFSSFFKKEGVVVALLFILLFRFSEAQLVKMVTPFLLDSREIGGLGLSTAMVGVVYGTVGIIGLTIGGIIGGVVVSIGGLKKWLWPMALSISLPTFTFVYLATVQPESLFIINLAVFVEQFGYGFGFTAFMLYMIYFAEGPHKTAHYAIATAFMALGMMIPGMISGWLQELMGYKLFFWWIMGGFSLTFLVTSLVKVDENYGKKEL